MSRLLLAVAGVLLLAGCADLPPVAPPAAPPAVPSPAVPSPSAPAPAPPPVFETVSVGEACAAAMKAAAEIPEEETAAFEFSATVSACATMDEWGSALRQHPGALGLETVADADIALGIELTCLQAATEGATTPLCAEARDAGYLD